MYYKYLLCQILSHDFDKKFDFLNYEFSIRLPTISQLKKERVGSREDVTSTNQDTRRRIKHEPHTPLPHTKVAMFVLMS